MTTIDINAVPSIELDIDDTQKFDLTLVNAQGPSGPQGPIGTGGVLGYYGSFTDTGTYPLTTIGAAQVIPIGNTLESNGVSITSGNRITFAEAGTYSLTFSIQLKNNQNNVVNGTTIWIKYQGADWPNSASHVDVPALRNSIPGATIATINFVASAQGNGDYVQLYWTGTSTDLSIVTYPANGVHPAAPAVIVGVTQVMYTQLGPQGEQGEKGDTGDVNPEMYTILSAAEDARDASVVAAGDSQDSADAASLSAAAANTSALAAADSALAAQQSQTDAETAKDQAQTAAGEAQAASTASINLATNFDVAVTTLAPSSEATSDYDPETFLLSLGIPEGVKGDTGATGATGPAGADGDSAYEVAVSNGFIGTEAQWLASLVGATGPQGETGPQGPAGVNATPISAIGFSIDGGGATITTGLIKNGLFIPFSCTINSVTLLADQSGSIVIDIWKDSYGNYPPTVADSICASAKPALSTELKSQDTTLTGWTTSITAGDVLYFNVDSATTVQNVTLTLKVTKT